MKNRLKILRAERDWNQQQLAEALGVSRQSVNAIETGKYEEIAANWGLEEGMIDKPVINGAIS